MKIKNLLTLTAMATMAFTACNKDENGAGAGDNTPKSVTLSLKNVVAGTRAASDAVKAGKVEVKNLQVLFVANNGNLIQGKTVGNEPAQHYFDFESPKEQTELDGFSKEFHFLPANVTKVIVVGNIGEVSATDVTGLKKELNIDDEQDADRLSLYAEKTLDVVSGLDDEEHPVYEVAVTLAPRVSRIEVVNFSYTGSSHEYESIEVKQIVLNNYYTSANFADGKVGDTKVSEPISTETAPKFFAEAAGWSSDKFGGNGNPLSAITLSAANESMAYTDNAQRPAYHFFPNAADIKEESGHPQLVVQLIGTRDGIQEPLFLATSGFSVPVSPDFAQLYRVNFAFDDSVLQNPEKCVEVSVDVVEWVLREVDAQFPNPDPDNN